MIWLVFQTLLLQVLTIDQFLWVKICGININTMGIVLVLNKLVEIDSDGSVSCGTMISLTKLIAHSSSATERFSVRRYVNLVGWKMHPCNSRRNWRRSKNSESCQNFCQLVLPHRSADTSNTSGLLKSESIGFSRSTRSWMGVPR